MENRRPAPVVIDLLSSDDEDLDNHLEAPQTLAHRDQQPRQLPLAAPPALPMEDQAEAGAPPHDDHNAAFNFAMPGAFGGWDFDGLPELPVEAQMPPPNPNGEYFMFDDGEQIFIPSSPPPAAPAVPTTNSNAPAITTAPTHATATAPAPAPTEDNFTADTCLQQVLAIFPDVCHDHVTKLYNDFDARDGYQAFSGLSRFENIVDQLASADSYPKHDRGKKRKRETEMEDDAKRWEGRDREPLPAAARGSIHSIVKADFPEVPVSVIQTALAEHKQLYQTYIAIANAKDTGTREWRGRPRIGLANADIIADGSGIATLGEELQAARKRVQSIREQRAKDEAQKRVEAENRERAILAGETAECQACFDDYPMNRQMHCNGDVAHFTCFECMEAYVKSKVGDTRCDVICTAADCGAGFAHDQMHLLQDKKLLEKLEQLQQEKDIRDAGLDDLEECPFCDFKAILPPVEEDFEFRCGKPECGQVSCRRCKAVSHVPKSCEEHAKDNKLDSRHKIEEAMTAALIRSCNKCKKQFIKEMGCNKMTCPSCGNLQCYVCSESLKNYEHFDGQGRPGGRTTAGGQPKKCPLYDNVEERHEREVKEAEAKARAQALEDNPDVTEQDLEIKVSDAVKKATQDRIQRNRVPGMVPGGYGGGLFAGADMDDMLADMGADFDEEDFEDPLMLGLAPPRRRQYADIRNRLAARVRGRQPEDLPFMRAARERQAEVFRQRFVAPPYAVGGAAPPALAMHAAAQAPRIPPALGPLAGVIPVYGMQPANHNYPAPPQRAPQAPQLGGFPGHIRGGQANGPDLINAFFDEPFRDDDAGLADLYRLFDDGPAPQPIPMPAPAPPIRRADPVGAQEGLQRNVHQEQVRQQRNANQEVIRQERERYQAGLRQAHQIGQQQVERVRAVRQRYENAGLDHQRVQQQLRDAAVNMHRNAGQARDLPPGDPRRYHRLGGP